jgi:hypothetical protein
MTRFWYILKNLDPFEIPLKHIILLHFKENLTIKLFQVAWKQWRTFYIGCVSQPYFEGSVRIKLTFLNLGLGSLPGLPKFQSSIVGVKTPCIRVFFISLESYWSVDVKNGFAWAIWTSATQVMTKRKAGNQTTSVTPDH